MRKVKYNLYNKIENDSTLSRLELCFLFYLLSHQDEYGGVTGLYYKDVIQTLGCSVSGFYLVRDSLVKKGYIKWDKSATCDMDIIIFDNNFAENGRVEYRDYVDINISIFNNKSFFKCKAGAIRTAMYLVKRTAAAGAVTQANSHACDSKEAESKRKLWFKGRQDIETLKSIIGVSVREIKEYLKQLKEFISNARVQKDGKYYQVFTVHKKSLVHPAGYAEQKHNRQVIRSFCRRNRIEYEEKHLNDTADLIRQYQKTADTAGVGMLTYLCLAIQNACSTVLNSYNTHRALRSLFQYAAPGIFE